jgi:hypothetical protein
MAWKCENPVFCKGFFEFSQAMICNATSALGIVHEVETLAQPARENG